MQYRGPRRRQSPQLHFISKSTFGDHDTANYKTTANVVVALPAQLGTSATGTLTTALADSKTVKFTVTYRNLRRSGAKEYQIVWGDCSAEAFFLAEIQLGNAGIANANLSLGHVGLFPDLDTLDVSGQVASGSGTRYLAHTETDGNDFLIGNLVVANGGTGYSAGQELSLVQGANAKDAKVKVLAVSAAGAVTHAALSKLGEGYTTGNATVAEAGGAQFTIQAKTEALVNTGFVVSNQLPVEFTVNEVAPNTWSADALSTFRKALGRTASAASYLEAQIAEGIFSHRILPVDRTDRLLELSRSATVSLTAADATNLSGAMRTASSSNSRRSKLPTPTDGLASSVPRARSTPRSARGRLRGGRQQRSHDSASAPRVQLDE